MPDNEETVDFRDLLRQPMANFPDRPNLPGGKHFYGKLTKCSFDYSTRQGTPYLQFDARLTDPGNDVPSEAMDELAKAGLSLADYDTYSRFYLTPRAMPMLRRFLETLGFPQGNFDKQLKLSKQCEPTAETQEVVRGLDVLVRTQLADEQGRVFPNLDMMIGTKRD